ncbi:hypothetical protein BGW37DRAFT_470653 [Umbelopsis sp. PMI_123]|nr:hypothetical protein BGW37DRAFT_470653 [Umbelopsis sp. PMI_123]
MICLDEDTCESVFQWSVHNFINPQMDMVILVNVRPSEHITTPYGNQTDYLIKIAERHRDESHNLLKKYGAQLTEKKIACKAISMHGDAQYEIVSKAQEVKADVVIVGSHGSGFLKRALLGSVSQYCVNHCDCTVIVSKFPRLGSADTTSM